MLVYLASLSVPMLILISQRAERCRPRSGRLICISGSFTAPYNSYCSAWRSILQWLLTATRDYAIEGFSFQFPRARVTAAADTKQRRANHRGMSELGNMMNKTHVYWSNIIMQSIQLCCTQTHTVTKVTSFPHNANEFQQRDFDDLCTLITNL